jgi:multidrug transporter EmrE-like cation transporter
MTDKINSVKKVSPFLLMLILIGFILSLVALYAAVDSLLNQTDAIDAYSWLAIGCGGLALSAYMLFQTRTKPMHNVLELPRVITTLECPKCDFKNIRDFQREDYIFKKEGSCQKCNETMTITAIYREEKKKP